MRAADPEEAVERDALTLLDLIAREPMKRSAYYACTLRWGENRFQRARRWLVERGFVRAGQDGQKTRYEVTREGLAFLMGAKIRATKEPERNEKASRREETEKILVGIVKRSRRSISTGEVYRRYLEECKSRGIAPLSLRYVRAILKELAQRGVIKERMFYGGAHGNFVRYRYNWGGKGG